MKNKILLLQKHSTIVIRMCPCLSYLKYWHFCRLLWYEILIQILFSQLKTLNKNYIYAYREKKNILCSSILKIINCKVMSDKKRLCIILYHSMPQLMRVMETDHNYFF